VDTLPLAWIGQTTPGGYIITPWRLPFLNGLLLRLQVAGDGSATGNFIDTAVFMPMRSQRPPRDDVTVDQTVEPEWSDLHPRRIINDGHAQYGVAFLVGECYEWTERHDDGYVIRIDDPSSGSWTTVTVSDDSDGPYAVRHGGPRHLWDEIVSAHAWWEGVGSPEFTRFGVTVTQKGQSVWLDAPQNPVPTC
jgi:hypothetical protein